MSSATTPLTIDAAIAAFEPVEQQYENDQSTLVGAQQALAALQTQQASDLQNFQAKQANDLQTFQSNQAQALQQAQDSVNSATTAVANDKPAYQTALNNLLAAVQSVAQNLSLKKHLSSRKGAFA